MITLRFVSRSRSPSCLQCGTEQLVIAAATVRTHHNCHLCTLVAKNGGMCSNAAITRLEDRQEVAIDFGQFGFGPTFSRLWPI